MSLNANSRFSVTPSADISRSRFDRSHQHKTTFNAGELIPFYVDECLPGDTISLDLSALVRLSTPIFPTMDNAYLDTYFFFVPNRLVWDHWKEFMGENTSSYWTPTTEYAVPMTMAPDETYTGVVGSPDPIIGWDKGSIADYMGIPTGVPNIYVSSLYFRAYVLIWNEWFRDQSTMQPAYLDKGDGNHWGSTRAEAEYIASETAGIPFRDAVLGSMPLPVCRFHDYFSSSLPQPQRGAAVEIPLFDADLPVTTLDENHGYASYADAAVRTVSGSGAPTGSYPLVAGNSSNVTFDTSASGTASGFKFIPANLGVEKDNVAAATIMQLRQAFQIQKLLERDARGGGRYREIIHSHFGVTSPDSRMQVPEYLGGKRVPINIDQVLQTSETTETSPQGNTAAFSLTTDVSSMFTKSFTEHGMIIGLCCVRTDNTYQQGFNRMFTRQRRYDYYWPELANLSEQPIFRQEIFATEGAGSYTPEGPNFDVFGYQEAWAEYRYRPSMVTGAFRSNYDQSLDAWHYADYYEGDPENFLLQAQWMKSPARENIDRTLAVQSSVEDQFIADFYFKSIWTRPMPLYSVPGLADHH